MLVKPLQITKTHHYRLNKLTYFSIDLNQLYSQHIKFHNDKTYALRYSHYI
jgi:hypothetical protein